MLLPYSLVASRAWQNVVVSVCFGVDDLLCVRPVPKGHRRCRRRCHHLSHHLHRRCLVPRHTIRCHMRRRGRASFFSARRGLPSQHFRFFSMRNPSSFVPCVSISRLPSVAWNVSLSMRRMADCSAQRGSTPMSRQVVDTGSIFLLAPSRSSAGNRRNFSFGQCYSPETWGRFLGRHSRSAISSSRAMADGAVRSTPKRRWKIFLLL